MNQHPFRLVLLALVALCIVGATGTTPSDAPQDRPHSQAIPRAPDASAPADGGDGGDLVQPIGDGTAAPVRLEVPRLGIDTGLERLRTGRKGQLLAPQEWQRAGWFADGTRPGDVGPAVIAGHVDSSTGPAVFSRLSEVRPGDRVQVKQADGQTAVFEVERTQVASKAEFPTRSVYGATPDAELRLITCDGPYVESSGGYQDNLIVYANEVS